MHSSFARSDDPVCPFNGTFCDTRCRAYIAGGDDGACARMEAWEDVRRAAIALIRACSKSDGRRDAHLENLPT